MRLHRTTWRPVYIRSPTPLAGRQRRQIPTCRRRLANMRIRGRAVALVVSVGAVAACSGGGSSSAHVTTVNGHPDPAAIAAKFGCTGYGVNTEGPSELFSATDGTCSYNGSDVTILTFASSGTESQWRNTAKQVAGGATGTTVVGSRFVVETDNADTAAAIAAKVGGQAE